MMGDEQLKQVHFLLPGIHLKFVESNAGRTHQGGREDGRNIVNGHQVDVRHGRKVIKMDEKIFERVRVSRWQVVGNSVSQRNDAIGQGRFF